MSSVQEHCKRVAALAAEIGTLLGLPAESRLLLEQAGLMHHTSLETFRSRGVDRLIGDVCVESWHVVGADAGGKGLGRGVGLLGQATDLVRASHDRERLRDEKFALLAGILDAANLFDERLDLLPYDDTTPEQIWREFLAISRDGFWPHAVASAFNRLCLIRDAEARAIAASLPVFPAAVFKALALAADSNASMTQLEKLISSDQVLAGELIRAANSALNGRRESISTIRHAAVFLGLEITRKVIAAAALKPIVVSAGLAQLWRHSLEMAARMEAIAARTGCVPPMEGYLTGLVHDAGRLVLARAPERAARIYARLLERQCPPAFAERILTGRDHGEIGADVLAQWRFPSHIREAVRHHHRPERSESALASLLYLADYRSGEDAASGVRLDWAVSRAGMTLAEVESAQIAPQPVIAGLTQVA